jgi:hypothetical protein
MSSKVPRELATPWKRKKVEVINLGTATGKFADAMICMNSIPALSRYPDVAPSGGVCDEWVHVGANTEAVLCSNCVQRLMHGTGNWSYTEELENEKEEAS